MQLQLFSGKMQNNKLIPILIHINVETGILSTSYRKMCVIHSALSSHPLIYIVQSCYVVAERGRTRYICSCVSSYF